MEKRYKKKRYLKVSAFGFLFLQNKRSCCNYISPEVLSFFPSAQMQEKPYADFILPPFKTDSDEVFTDEFSEYSKLCDLKYVRYVGKRWVLCYDGKYRNCRHYKIIYKDWDSDSDDLHVALFACDVSLLHKRNKGVAGVIKF